VLLYLRDKAAPCQILGAVLSYGCFDLSITPSVYDLNPQRPLVLSLEDVVQFFDAYLPGMGAEQRKNPKISPAYNKLHNLPPALFIVGTEDGLTDDTILMSGRWTLSGNEAVVKFVAGAPHGFMTFDGYKSATVMHGWQLAIQYINSKALASHKKGQDYGLDRL
jgi:acetyl esterase